MSKKYKAELTVTQAVADRSHGGVIYYFCHIHSKMSGKIRILNADGSAFTPTANPTELPLYSVHEVTPVDNVCGTSGLEPYSFGKEHACSERYICGDLDTDFEKCLDAMNCEMKTNMHRHTTADHSDKIAVFMQQMIPHHKNAINMAKLLLKQAPAADIYAAFEDPEAPDDNGLENILYDIISVQSYQVHQFRNYLGPLGLLPSDGYSENQNDACTPSPTNICMSMNFFASETGYYEFKGHVGPSPEITVRIGETITFDQTDPSNWYHPVGFAYEPDGAHGSTWGGEELDEVDGIAHPYGTGYGYAEAVGAQLQYKIDGAAPTCADHLETGLDCYEPEFFFPREEWMSKKYTAELTVTQAVADASHGGVIYYFCHIHSKMSGKIRILNADGTAFTPTANPAELPLYSVHEVTPVDNVCGTSGA